MADGICHVERLANMLTRVNARDAQVLDAQREAKGLRAFAQPRLSVGLGIIVYLPSMWNCRLDFVS